MKQLTEYTTKNLYGLFKPEELCFIVERDYDCIDELSYLTDDLDNALSEAKENDYKIFVYEKKFAIECLDTNLLFKDMLENIQEEGFDVEYVLYCVKKNAKGAEEEFSKLIKKWFDKYVGNTYWFTDRLLGTLRLNENQGKGINELKKFILNNKENDARLYESAVATDISVSKLES